MTTLRRSAALLAGAALVTAATAAPMTGSQATPAPPKTLPTSNLDILLTNDDGWSEVGITAVYDKLTAAGHRVTMSAPLTNQSGVSAKVTLGSSGVGVVNQAPNKWSVADSPVTSMIFGLEHLYKKNDKLPDLVISGTNVGPNVGYDTNFSGTVGAAITAAGLYDLPAIAVSTDLSKTEYPPNPATGSYDKTADLLVDMIAKGVPDLANGEVININYPDLDENLTEPKGIKYVSNSQKSLLTFNFIQRPDNAALFAIQPGAGPLPSASPANSDIRELAAGYVTVGVLKSDRSVPAAESPAVTSLIRRLTGESEPPTPPTPPTPVVKTTVEKLPRKVLAKTSQWLKATGAEHTTLRITWKPTGKKTAGKKTKKVTLTTSVSDRLVRLQSPKRKGTYRVTVTSGKTTVRTGTVRVL